MCVSIRQDVGVLDVFNIAPSVSRSFQIQRHLFKLECSILQSSFHTEKGEEAVIEHLYADFIQLPSAVSVSEIAETDSRQPKTELSVV